MLRRAGSHCSVDSAVMATSSSFSEADTSTSSISESSCVLSLSYSVSDAGSKSQDSPGKALELHLYDPVVSDSSTHSDDSQESQRFQSAG